MGHTILVAAIIAALVACLTKGKTDESMLIRDIGRSPRLGPKVAKWLDQNRNKLRQHPALQSRGSGASGAGAPSLDPSPHPRPQHTPARNDSYRLRGMPQKVVPCFKTNGLRQGSMPEFDRQLAGQETGINNMTIDEYLTGRSAFDSKMSVRDPSVARKARAAYERTLAEDLFEELRLRGVSRSQAKVTAADMASNTMRTLAALHHPDMVAGGKDVICDFGDCRINSRIGAQWNKGGRLAELDKAATAIPASMRAGIKMNAKLERCK